MSGGPQVFLGATTFLSRCRQISGRGLACWAGLLGVPVGGGPPARRPRCELRSARRLEARPGPATAHGHRSPALRSLRRPPHQWRLVADAWFGASSRSPVGPYRRPRAPQPGPPAPSGPSGVLLWCACSGEEALFWIGTALLDSLLTYPERNNLFRLLFPIQFGGVCRPGGLLAAWQWGFCTT